MPHQVRPYGWEGFRAYNMTYLMRAKGLNFQGAEAIYVLNADCLMVIELKRLRTGDLEIGMADLSEEYYVEWPTRKIAGASNYTRRFRARANRYESTEFTFKEGHAHDTLKDLHGQPYSCPHGMISLETISDSPCFVSLPHFYGNEEWGGFEARQVYFDTKYDRRLHSYYIDIEPISGQAVREARRFQFNFRLERNMQFPQIISSQQRCEVPTAAFSENGYGCFMFFPVWWVSEERHIDSSKALRLKRQILEIPEEVFYTALYGAAVGLTLIFLGFVPWYITNQREKTFRQRIYID